MKFCASRRMDAQKQVLSRVRRLSVPLFFKYEMLPGSIFVLPFDSPLSSLAFVHIKTGGVVLLSCCVGNVQMKASVHSAGP